MKNKLSDKQLKELDNIYNSIDKDTKATLNIVNNSKIKAVANKIKYLDTKFINILLLEEFKIFKIIFLLSTGLLMSIILTLMFIPNKSIDGLKEISDTKMSNSTLINVYSENDCKTINVDINNVVINANNKLMSIDTKGWIDSDIELNSNTYNIDDKSIMIDNKLSLNKIKLTENSAYIQYNNKSNTASKELIYSDKESRTGVDTSSLRKVTSRVYESNNITLLKCSANSYNKAFIMLIEHIAGGELHNKSLKNELYKIEETTKQSNINNSEMNVKIMLDTLGGLNTKEITEVADNTEVTYDNKLNVINITNSKENITYIKISGLDNSDTKCFTNSLLSTTNKAIFVSKDFRQNNNQYENIAIASENKIYVISINKIAFESISKQLFKQLGIDCECIEIKNVQTEIKVEN